MKVVLFNSLTKKGILMTLKSTRDMIEKVNITDANVVELIREKLPAATEANKGLCKLMDLNKVRIY